MTANKMLGKNGQQLSSQLMAIAHASKNKKPASRLINVPGVGKDVYFAYERLRNAAEYTQEHLLTQKAIRRFFVRNLSFISNSLKSSSATAEELIIELIQSGYIENDVLPLETIDTISAIIQTHYDNFWRLRHIGVKMGSAEGWTLDLLSVACEKVIRDNQKQVVFVQFAYRHYQSILRKSLFVSSKKDETNFEASLYVAISKALFKVDISSVRHDMQELYQVPDGNIHDYANFHKNIDEMYSSELTEKLTNYINKYGAPLRVLKNMIESNDNLGEMMTHSARFHSAYATQIEKEYIEAKAKLNSGLIKSIIFLFITKTLIGVAIEVPYDLMVYKEIILLPLIVNLLTPIVYMALLRLGLKMPGEANTRAMEAYAENMIYGDDNQVNLYPSAKRTTYPIGFRIAYFLMFLLVFGVVTNLLINLEFNIVQGIIFFVFFATANFLGFRLSRIVSEMEIVISKAGFLVTLRDFVYMPFILLGQWISDKYSKVNIVALVLDIIIELPLKSLLRVVRQWTEFINDKKDQI